MNRQDYIDDFLRHGSDLIPYSDPDYQQKIMQMANEYADFMISSLELENTEFDYGHNVKHTINE